ncbi:MAG: tripartite tricarboxylate transporter substrate-binding protein [Burkholderiales bacterium]
MHASRIAPFVVTACALQPAAAPAQDAYPSKVIRIVTSAAGGNADVLARFVATGLTSAMGQQVIVDNRGAIAPAVVAKAPPDGYTLLVNGSPQWLLPLLRPGTPWDAVKEFAPVTLATNSPSLLVAHPSLPVKTVAELIALARARPGELNYAVGTPGATPHIAGELFKSMAKVNVVRVGYKGTGPGVLAVMTGETHFMFPGAPAAMPYVKQGRLKALGVCSLEPSALTPGIPTVAATGLPGFESVSPQAVFAPAGTPAPLVNRLQQEIAKVLHGEEVKQRLFSAGSEVVAGTPQALAQTMQRDIARIQRLVKETGLSER